MNLKEMMELAETRLYPGVEGRPTLDAYCHSVALSLTEAMAQKQVGRPAKFTGRESQKVLRGRGDAAVRSEEDLDDYVPTPGDPTGWGSSVADAMITLACLCRMYKIDLDAVVERKLRRYTKEKK